MPNPLVKIKEILFPKDSYSLNDLQKLLDEQKAICGATKLDGMITVLDVLDDNKTIYTKNNAICQLIKLEGIDYSGLSSAKSDSLFEMRKRLFESLSTSITLTFHYHRRKIRADDLSNFDTDNKYAKKIADLWYQNFNDSFKTDIYLLVRKNIPFKPESILNILKAEINKDSLKLKKALDELEIEVINICKKLEDYKPVIATHSKDSKSEIIKFFNFLINNDLRDHLTPVNLQSNKVGSILSLSDIEIDKEEKTITLIGDDKKRYCQILCLKNYPESETNGSMLNDLLRSQYQFNIVQHIIPKDRDVTKLSIQDRINKIKAVDFMGFYSKRLEDLTEAGEASESGDLVFHDHIFLIYIYADTKKELISSRNNIRGILGQNGIETITEGRGLELAYWSFLPDHEKLHDGRRDDSSSGNLSDFITLPSSSEGFDKCDFGNYPTAIFKTTSSSNYFFTFHNSPDQEALAHTMVIGGSNAGKTTLTAFLLMNALKYQDSRILCFDYMNGLKIPITAFGGDYINSLDSFNLNPLLLPNRDENRQFLTEFIKMLSGGSKSSEEKELIAEIIKQNYQLHPKERNLEIIRSICGESYIDKDGNENLTARCEQWLPGEEGHHIYSKIFNSSRDSLSFTKRMVGFDMANYIENKELLPPLTSYIFHAFDNAMRHNNYPFICFIDEFGKFINSVFGDFALTAIRQWRKRRGIFIAAVQEAEMITRTEIGRKAIKSLATLILFPDSNADAGDYIDELGLNDQEFNWVRNADTKNRQVMIKRRGGNSVIINVDLSSLGRYLNLFTSSSANVNILEKYQKQASSNPIEEYLKEVSK